jgi:HK97 family phage portal protein
MDAQTFKEIMQANILLWGNGYAEIRRGMDNNVKEIWPLDPQRVLVQIKNRVLSYRVENEKTVSELDYKSVLHIKGLGSDGYKGYSVINYAADNLALTISAERDAALLYKNGSTPPGILTVEGTLTKEAKEQAEKQWKEKHSGDNKGNIAVLHSGLKYQSIAMPAKDAQLLESRKFGITDIARWFQIPPHMIGDLDRATFSNIEHQGIQFVTMTLQRWLSKWQHEINYKLFNTDEQKTYFSEFLTDALMKGDTLQRANAYQIALGGNNSPGYITVNEVRIRENLPPVDGGDKLFMPSYGDGNDTDVDDDDNSNRYEGLIKTTWRRLLTKEDNAIKKAIKRHETFRQFVDDFYGKHESHVVSVLSPVIRAYCDDDSAVESIAKDYISRRKQSVLAEFESGKLSERLNNDNED